MTNSTRLAVFAALGLGLAACADANPQPPIAGTDRGVAGQSAIKVEQNQIPQDAREATSAGTPSLTGTVGGGERPGRPSVTYTGPASSNQLGGGIPQEFRPPIVRPRGGGE